MVALDNIDLNQVGHRYVSDVLKNYWNNAYNKTFGKTEVSWAWLLLRKLDGAQFPRIKP